MAVKPVEVAPASFENFRTLLKAAASERKTRTKKKVKFGNIFGNMRQRRLRRKPGKPYKYKGKKRHEIKKLAVAALRERKENMKYKRMSACQRGIDKYIATHRHCGGSAPRRKPGKKQKI